eukprot:gene21618-28620_t
MQCIQKNLAKPVRTLPEARRQRIVCKATEAYVPPSQAASATAYASLSRLTQCVPDVFPGGPVKATAATINVAALSHILASESLGLKEAANAIVAAMNYDKCKVLTGEAKTICQLEKAMVNVGTFCASQAPILSITLILPGVAEAMFNHGMKLVELYKENGVKSSRLIIRLPATWAGIQAAGKLEAEGVATQVFLVYSFIQGVAAAQAGVSVIQPNVGRTNDWYARNPNVIRDPHGLCQDSGYSSSINVGVKLVHDLYTYCQKYHPKTKIMASGVRNHADALALSGVDYMILPVSVMKDLEVVPTIAGYNDGLHPLAGSGVDDQTLRPLMSQDLAAATQMEKVGIIDEETFNDGIGMAGADLLEAGLHLKAQDLKRLKPLLSKSITSGATPAIYHQRAMHLSGCSRGLPCSRTHRQRTQLLKLEPHALTRRSVLRAPSSQSHAHPLQYGPSLFQGPQPLSLSLSPSGLAPASAPEFSSVTSQTETILAWFRKFTSAILCLAGLGIWTALSSANVGAAAPFWASSSLASLTAMDHTAAGTMWP